MRKITEYEKTVLGAYATAVGAAIRNSIDPNDPDREYYMSQIRPRYVECIKYIKEIGAEQRDVQAFIDARICGQLRFLLSGLLDELRDSIQEH